MLISADTEVPGLHRSLTPFMVTLCDENGSAQAFEWPVDPFTRSVAVLQRDVIEIANYLQGNEIIFHHGQFDLLKLANIGIRLAVDKWIVPQSKYSKQTIVVPVKAIHETMLMSHLCDSRGVYLKRGNEAKSSHALKELCLVRLGVSDRDEIALRKAVQSARLKADKLGWNTGASIGEDYWLPKALWEARHGQTASFDHIKIPIEWESLCRDYALCDVRERTMSLFLTCREMLQNDGRWEMYLDEMPLIPIYYMLEGTGLRTDSKRRKKIATDFNAKAEHHKSRSTKLAKAPTMNIDADPQLRKLLFEDWNLGVTTLTPKRQEPSVNAKTLEALRDYLAFHREKTDPKLNATAYEFLTHMIGEKDYENSTDTVPIIKRPGYRQYIKYLGYLNFYSKEAVDDIFHATIFPTGTNTTRISTKGSQNVGKKKVDGVSLRNAFGPEPGWIWVSIDYEQLELRIFANQSGDQRLIDAFDEGYDFHAFVASIIFNLSPEKITSEQRRIAKNTNFALIFGGSPWKVDYTAGMKGAYDLFVKQFPKAREFMDDSIATIQREGFITTADGYPLYTPESEPYKATDYRIQGTAGRIIKLAMKWLMYGRTLKPLIDWSTLKMLLQIHDELVFSVDIRKRSRKDTVRLVRQIATMMEQAGQSFGIATPVSCSIHTDNWGESVSLNDYAMGA